MDEGALQRREHGRNRISIRSDKSADDLRRLVVRATGAVGKRFVARTGQRAVQVYRRWHDLAPTDERIAYVRAGIGTDWIRHRAQRSKSHLCQRRRAATWRYLWFR